MNLNKFNFLNFSTKLNHLRLLKNKKLNELKFIEKKQQKLQYEKVCYLKTLNQPEQLSKEWFDLRTEIFTASADVYHICGYLKQPKTLNTLNRVILKKCGEGPVFKGNKYTEWGQKYEDIAIDIYQNRHNKEVLEFGLLRHPTISVLGASPDGICTDGTMLEIKCPSGRKISGEIKKEYAVQMQVQMEVCDLDSCDFFECNITEYDNYMKYKEDKYTGNIFYLDIMPRTFNIDLIKLPNNRRTATGLEKGMIGTYYENKEKYIKKWVYPPFNIDSDKQYEWLLKEKKKYNKMGKDFFINFWKLELSSLNHVKRDKKWWESRNITKQLYDAWDKVEDARKNGVKKYLIKKRAKKTEIKTETVKFTEYMFVDSD